MPATSPSTRTAPTPSPVPRPRALVERSLLREQLGEAQYAELSEVLAAAERLVGGTSLPRLAEVHDFSTAGAALATGWQAVRRALAGDRRWAEAVAESDSLEDLLERVTGAERRLRDAEVRYRDTAVRKAREALEGLREVSTMQQLFTAGAEAVCRLGFDRSIVSSVEESWWLTEAIHVDGDSEWADEILAAGRAAPQQLTAGLPEQEMMRRRRPILVTRVQQREAVHKPVAETSQSRSYVAAPVATSRGVVGFLHSDRFFHAGDVSAFDCDLLGMFAQGFSFAVERAMALEELARVRHDVRLLAAGLERVALGAGRPEVAGTAGPVPLGGGGVLGGFRGAGSMGSAGAAGSHVLRMEPVADPDSRLTRREVEVLQYMAAGDTNQRIARRLVISEGTVKSHVKHILRKLGAANRAEAVAKWHSGTGR